MVGEGVGSSVGAGVGFPVGCEVGTLVGNGVVKDAGNADGINVGASVSQSGAGIFHEQSSP